MKRAILFRFCLILFLALTVCSAISYVLIGGKLFGNEREKLLQVARMTDYSLTDKEDLHFQLKRIRDLQHDDEFRLTIMDAKGNVLADSSVESTSKMDNHADREEVKQAMESGEGTASRMSDTAGMPMLYVAIQSADKEKIIRCADSYDGIATFLPILWPTLGISFVFSFIAALIITIRLTESITTPLDQIATEFQNVESEANDWKFSFDHYKYEELNIISESAEKLADVVKEHMQKTEFERKVRQEFFSNASHELKTPITSIRGYAELLDNDIIPDEEVRKSFVKRILKSTENMTQLIEDILMISRLETKDTEVVYTMVQMPVLVNEICEDIIPIAAEYQVEVIAKCDPVAIEANAGQIRQLLMNLIINGIKYNRPGGKVWITIQEGEHNVVIRVKDDGMGIGEADQSRVFERFYRVDKGRSKKVGGTGLGLSIVKHITEYYDGYLQLNSAPGEGSEFIISLPIYRHLREHF